MRLRSGHSGPMNPGSPIPGETGPPMLPAVHPRNTLGSPSRGPTDLALLVEGIPVVLYHYRAMPTGDQRILFLSSRIASLVGHRSEEFFADPGLWQRLVEPDDLPILEAAWTGRHAIGDSVRLEYRMRGRNNRVVSVRDDAIVADVDHGVTTWQGVLSDVSERSPRACGIDPDASNGLVDRATMDTALEGAFARARTTSVPLAVLFCDLTSFKAINDVFGRETGDRLLAEVGRRINAAVRGSDIVAWLGGDEFAVILPRVEDETAAVAVVERITSAIEAPFTVRDGTASVGISIGLAVFPDHAVESGSALLRRAAAAMYRAKRERVSLRIASPQLDETGGGVKFNRLGELRAALEGHQFILFYQPWLRPVTGEMDVVEALVRWNHPTRGILAPSEFLAFTEQSGLIRTLDLEVLEMACAQAAAWRDAGRSLRVAINIGLDSLIDEQFCLSVAAALIRHRLEGHEIEIEITENGIMGDPGAAAFFAERLAELGIRLALDDFGTGYSSLSQFRRIRVSTLKVDRSFVAEMCLNNDDRAIVETVVALGHRFGLEVVAEGVEDAATFEALTKLGVEYIQGYFVSRPLAPAALGAWLDAQPAATATGTR